jgi:hypothetical protein
LSCDPFNKYTTPLVHHPWPVPSIHTDCHAAQIHRQMGMHSHGAIWTRFNPQRTAYPFAKWICWCAIGPSQLITRKLVISIK